jgi:hypothetical protein
VGNQALAAWNVGLIVVKDRFGGLIAAFPFNIIEPAPKPLLKPTPPEGELTVKTLIAVATCPSMSVTTTLCLPTMAVDDIESVAVIFVAEL